MKYRRLVIAGLAASLSLTAAACGGGDEEPAEPNDAPTTTEHDMSQMAPGETMAEDYEEDEGGE